MGALEISITIPSVFAKIVAGGGARFVWEDEVASIIAK
tara:strand:+ start:481 stop:594 length:114 start_codon:yes stop_codon:yes gene_type:complete